MILKEPDPILVAHLFAPMRDELLKILSRLQPSQWALPTACEGWTVKDITLHLLGDDIGLLSRRRDAFTHLQADFGSFDELVAFINLQNDIWLRAARRMSPYVLLELLAVTGEGVEEWVRGLEPFGTGAPVDWVQSGASPQWMEIAREYTEYWTHHQHICDALGVTSLKTPKFFSPAVASFVRALPRGYSTLEVPKETAIELNITGAIMQQWYLVRMPQGWQLYARTSLEPASTLSVDAEVAWRLFTKGMTVEQARPQVIVEGKPELAEAFFRTVAVLA